MSFLVISFVIKLNGDERLKGDGLWLCHSFIIVIEACKKMESYIHGRKWMNVGER